MENSEEIKIANVYKEYTNELVINYLTLRKALGWMGLLLPCALIIGSFIWNDSHIETSISYYFYTCLRDVFVVTLSAISLFLFTYRGYDLKDRVITNIAGGFGLITAFVGTGFKHGITLPCYQLLSQRLDDSGRLLPLKDDCFCEPYTIIPNPQAGYLNYVHLVGAALFFLSLAYMSYFQFTLSENPVTPQKIKRNKVYKACGMIMLFCIIAMVPYFLLDSVRPFYDSYKLIFWGESFSLWAFGISWLIKGHFLLGDDENNQS